MMKLFFLTILVALALILSSVRSMGFFTLKSLKKYNDDEGYYHTQTVRDSTHRANPQVFFAPASTNKKGGNHNHNFDYNNSVQSERMIKKARSYNTHDEEILERLVELQN